MTDYRILRPEELAEIAKAPFQRAMMILPDGTPAVPIDAPQIGEVIPKACCGEPRADDGTEDK